MAMSAEHRSKFVALHRQWWRLHMSEKFSSGTNQTISSEAASHLVTFSEKNPYDEVDCFLELIFHFVLVVVMFLVDKSFHTLNRSVVLIIVNRSGEFTES